MDLLLVSTQRTVSSETAVYKLVFPKASIFKVGRGKNCI